MPEKYGGKAEKNENSQQFINHGAAMVGRGLGAAVTTAIASLGGPEAAIIGGIAGKTIENFIGEVGRDFSARLLSRREEERVGTVLVIAAEGIRQRLESGETLRKDGFFDEKQTGRSDAEEVVEHVLLKAQREPEEKKIQYMGYLLSSIAFESQINVHYAHQLTKVAEELTYQQLCILKLCVVKDKYGLRKENYRNQKTFTIQLYPVLDQCAHLHSREYITCGSEVGFGVTNTIPSAMNVQGIGRDLFNLMKLSSIPDEDIALIAEQLK